MEEIINEERAEVEELLGAPLPKVDEHVIVTRTKDSIAWMLNHADLIPAVASVAMGRSKSYLAALISNGGRTSADVLSEIAAVCGYSLALVPTDKLGMLPEDALVIKPEDKEG